MSRPCSAMAQPNPTNPASANAALPMKPATCVRAFPPNERPVDAETASLWVWPSPGVLAIFRFMSKTTIDFDVDLRELQGQDGVDTLCRMLYAIGSHLGKPALMVPEGGSQQYPVLGFDPVLGKVALLVDRTLTPTPARRGLR